MRELNYCVNGGAVRALYFETIEKNKPLIIDIHGGAFASGMQTTIVHCVKGWQKK